MDNEFLHKELTWANTFSMKTVGYLDPLHKSFVQEVWTVIKRHLIEEDPNE